MKRIHSSNWHYLILLTGLLILTFLYFTLSLEPFVQRLILIALGVFYFVWGIYHHLLAKDLHVKIVLEYLVFAVIGTLVLLSLTARF